jgi:branched-chain amino acid transport system substrate-binding protein
MTKSPAAKSTGKKIPPIVYITSVISLVLIALQVPKWFPGSQPLGSLNPLQPNLRMSTGETLLISADATLEKKRGVIALRDRNFSQADLSFRQSLAKVRNDPETLIYLNNIKAQDNPITIGVSVPISSNLNVAQEMLRGVAQAQDTINTQGGISGRLLQVAIADDDNNPDQARNIAKAFTQDQRILAVVGHNASNASLAAAPIYQQAGLVMISPTSSSNQLSGLGSYILRTIPSAHLLADQLADHVFNTEKKTKITACFDHNAPDNVDFKDAFIAAFTNRGGEWISIACDFSSPTFNPVTVLQQAMSSGAQGMLVTPHIDRLEPALALARSNQNKLALYSSPTLYTIKTLQLGQSSVANLTLPAVWHPQQPNAQNFNQQAQKLWGGTVNWRTATSYDAVQAIVTGLKTADNRETLQQTLRQPQFSAIGAGGSIQFLPSGDRQLKPILVQIRPTAAGYEFIPL